MSDGAVTANQFELYTFSKWALDATGEIIPEFFPAVRSQMFRKPDFADNLVPAATNPCQFLSINAQEGAIGIQDVTAERSLFQQIIQFICQCRKPLFDLVAV